MICVGNYKYCFLSQLGRLKRTVLPPVPDPNKDFGIALKGLKTGLKAILIDDWIFLDLINDDDELVVLIRDDICLSLIF